MKKIGLVLGLKVVSAFANPTGADIVQGEVILQTEGKALHIRASDKSIIHWEDFSIQLGEKTEFIQPSATSSVLNRVTGINPSLIRGILEANGRVILVNPSGIIVSKEGVIRTADFIATTTDILDLSNWEFRTDQAPLALGASLINHEGIIQATGVDISGGRVLLVADNVQVDGTIQAPGGQITLLANAVQVKPHATLTCSGITGGEILIGGDYQGSNPALFNAQSVHIAQGAKLTANNLGASDGGRIIVWSDKSTHFEADAEACGGPLGGDGGFVEISSKDHLHFHGFVDTKAPLGKMGMLLLDPSDITINAGPSNPAFTATYNPAVAGATIAVTDIITALASTNVSIATSNGIGGFGDITWIAGFPIASGMWTMPTSLSLNANRNIALNSDIICTAAGPINLTATRVINIGSGGAATSAHIATGGAINITAGTGVNIVAGNALAANSIVETTAVSAPINITATTGNVTISSATGNSQAAVGSSSSGAITFQIPQGDLLLLSDNQGQASINSQDHLNVTAENIQVNALGARPPTVVPGTCLIAINSTTGMASNIQLSASWIANAAPNPLGSPNYLFNFVSTPVTLTTGEDLVLSNTSNFAPGSGFMALGNGSSFTIHRNALIQANSVGGTTTLTTNQDLSMQVDGNLTLQNLSASPATFLTSAHLNVNVSGHVLIEATGLPQFSRFGSTANTGNITLTSLGNITLNHGGEIFVPSMGLATIIANESFSMTNGCLIDALNPPGAGCQLTIVVDNAFPSSPFIGPGLFGMDAASQIFPGSQALVQIYSARQAQNQINPMATINGATFTPGPFDVNTSTEHWSTYYAGGLFGSIPYLIFYKEPIQIIPLPIASPATPLPNFRLGPLTAIIGNMFDTIDEFEYPLPFFRDQFCIQWKVPEVGIARRLPPFGNDACFWTEVQNYRKYYPYREKQRAD